MTCCIGLVEQSSKRVLIGVDSVGSNGWTNTARLDSKLFRKGSFLIAFTTSFRMGQILRYHLDTKEVYLPKESNNPADEDELYKFMVSMFVPAVRECLKSNGFAEKQNEVESGGTFLVAVRGRLFVIYDDYQVAESADGFSAIGSGCQIALGAMYASGQTQGREAHSPNERIGIALKAAEYYCTSVRGPFTVQSVE